MPTYPNIKVLEALQWPTTTLDAAESRPGPNTRVKTNLLIQKWVDWSDFTFENITAVFGKLLDREYVG
ncbi:hypothetical protein MGU_09796 [Metarhizium guizhouense ARSEF 977]|uniref:Uncharacterized protein n=1 Tax=Metarhizium guizhouense (strain ARSEF 977) TaxID=1276136 RepID=A0A0B4GT36_METGA|nr:hypothetical protein MGU_09796 [Metarhizium guizhouense ARSEF 977]